MIILGHADNVTVETLDEFKKDNILIGQWFLDFIAIWTVIQTINQEY